MRRAHRQSQGYAPLGGCGQFRGSFRKWLVTKRDSANGMEPSTNQKQGLVGSSIRTVQNLGSEAKLTILGYKDQAPKTRRIEEGPREISKANLYTHFWREFPHSRLEALMGKRFSAGVNVAPRDGEDG